MDEQGQSPLVAAVMLGAVLPVAHVLAAWVALRMGWRRGYLRDGLLHGMLLGPLGLLTVLVLKRNRRATEALRIEYARITSDQYHVLFFSAWALLYVGAGVYYGMVIYKHLMPYAILPNLGTAAAIAAIALGYLAFCYAKPPSAWIPPLGDYEEYAEDPAYVTRQHFNYRYHVLKQRARTSGPYSLLLSLILVAALIAFLPLLGETVDPHAWWVQALLTATGLGYIAAQVCLYRRKRRAEKELPRFRFEHAADDPRWLPVVPLASRRRALWLDAQIRSTSARLRSCRTQGNWCLFSALGSVVSGIFIVTSYPTWWECAAVFGGVLPAFGLYKLSQRLAAPCEGLQQQLRALQEEDQALAARLQVLTTDYVQEQRYIEFAFGHEEVPDSLLARRIILPGRAQQNSPTANEADRDDAGQGEDDAQAKLEAEAGAAVPEAAGAIDNAGEIVPVAPVATSSPARACPAQATEWVGMRTIPHPQRVALERAASNYIGIAIRLLLVLRFAGALALPAMAVLALLSGWQILRAQLLPQTICVPRPESARLAPQAFLSAASAVADCGAEVSRDLPADPPVTAAQARQKRLLDDMLALDSRLALRGMALVFLLYPSLGLTLWLLGTYLASGSTPSSSATVTAVFWLAIAVPVLVWLWRGNTTLYWRRIQLQVNLPPTELWRRAESGQGYWQAWQRSARHRLRLLWLACGLLYGVLVLGGYWTAGVLRGPHTVPVAHWALLALGLAGAAGCLGYALARAHSTAQLWRARWIERLKQLQFQQYKEVMVYRSQAEVLEEHEGFQVEYNPQELDDATIARWVELDFTDLFRRDPVASWLERLRSLALAGCWCSVVLYLPLVDQEHCSKLQGWMLFWSIVFFVLAALFWLGRRWRSQALHN